MQETVVVDLALDAEMCKSKRAGHMQLRIAVNTA